MLTFWKICDPILFDSLNCKIYIFLYAGGEMLCESASKYSEIYLNPIHYITISTEKKSLNSTIHALFQIQQRLFTHLSVLLLRCSSPMK